MAKALPGRTYAQIVDGRVRWIFTIDELPEWNDDQAPAIDITELDAPPAIEDRFVDGQFLPAKTDEELKAQAQAAVQSNLVAIDDKSIRALREYIAKLPDAPAQVVEIEQQAVEERKKLDQKAGDTKIDEAVDPKTRGA